MISIPDGRGKHSKEKGEENFRRVKQWIQDNSDAMLKQCKEDLNLSYPTIAKHIKRIKEEG